MVLGFVFYFIFFEDLNDFLCVCELFKLFIDKN